jgi:hypothetical protein
MTNEQFTALTGIENPDYDAVTYALCQLGVFVTAYGEFDSKEQEIDNLIDLYHGWDGDTWVDQEPEGISTKNEYLFDMYEDEYKF